MNDNSSQYFPEIVVSIIIANYNRKDWLARCLTALEGQKPEYLEKTEVIIVDDGSTDGAREMILQYKGMSNVICILQKNEGPATARNNGIKKAKGEYVAFLDNDSIVFDNWLENVFNHLPDMKGTIVGVNGDTQSFPECANELSLALEKCLYGPDNWGTSNNLIYKKETIIRFGMFDESFPYPACEDFDLAYRIKKSGLDLMYCPEIKIYHPHESDWKTFKKKYMIHGYSFRHFCFKNMKQYPFSIIYFFVKEIAEFFIYLGIFPLLKLKGKYWKEYIYFFRAFYTIRGFFSKYNTVKTKDA